MKNKEIEKAYFEKIDQLKKYNKAYFEHDNPVVSDLNYDNLKHKIISLEKKYTFLRNKNSPSKNVGYKPSGKFRKIKHLKRETKKHFNGIK